MSLVALSPTPRRRFVRQLGVASAAIAAAWSKGWAESPAATPNSAAPAVDAWLTKIRGKHRQVFDCTTANAGFGAVYALNFIDSFKQTHNVPDSDVTAVVSYRHFSMPLTLDDATWAKYKIGEVISVNDPATNAPATRNIFRDNILLRPGLTYEQMMANRGVIMTACNMALNVLSGMAAGKVGVSADQAKKDWAAGVLPGVVIVPSGVYAVNRAQEKGCAYCYGG